MTPDPLVAALTQRPESVKLEVFAVFPARDRPFAYVYRTTAEAAWHTAHVWGRGAYAARRTEIHWPDGSGYYGPWEELAE